MTAHNWFRYPWPIKNLPYVNADRPKKRGVLVFKPRTSQIIDVIFLARLGLLKNRDDQHLVRLQVSDLLYLKECIDRAIDETKELERIEEETRKRRGIVVVPTKLKGVKV